MQAQLMGQNNPVVWKEIPEVSKLKKINPNVKSIIQRH